MEACWVGMCNERRRRKRQNDNQIDSDDENIVKKVKRQNDIMDQEIENVFSFVNAIFTITADKDIAERSPDEVRDSSIFENGYYNWSDKKFKKSLRITRDTFEHILEEILPDLIKTPTPMKPNPIIPATQLAITLYRLAHGCSLSTLEDVFGWSIPTNDKTFNYVCRVLVQRLYDRYVRLPKTEEEWIAEIKGFY